MLHRQIFQIVPRKHLIMIEALFWFSTQFHLMIILQITRRSTRCVFCSTSETCWVKKLAIMFCWVYVSSCDTPIRIRIQLENEIFAKKKVSIFFNKKRDKVTLVILLTCSKILDIPLNCFTNSNLIFIWHS